MAQRDDGLAFFLRIVGSYKLLKPHEAEELGRLVQEQSDVDARNKLVVHNLRAAVMVARRYRGRGLDFLDLIQEAVLGLMTAAEKFDPNKGFRFMTYAMWWIRQSVVRAIYDYSETIRIPVHVWELWNRIMRESAKLVDSLGREPQPDEVAKALGKPVEEVERALRQMRMTTVYLEDLLESANRDGDGGREIDWLPGMSDLSLLSPEHILLAQGELSEICAGIHRRVLSRLSSFSGRDKAMFRSRYGLDGSLETRTLEEVGQAFAVTRERVRQVVDKVWSQLQIHDQQADGVWLEGELYRIEQLADIVDPTVTQELLRVLGAEAEKPDVAGKQRKQASPSPLKPSAVIGAVCIVFRVSAHLLIGTSSKPKIEQARGVAALLLSLDLKRPFAQIAADLNKEVEQVTQSCAHTKQMLKKNRWLAEQVAEVRKIYR
jgi:RNA polymerase primary sigma factor